jgi:hypothetical protein
MDALSDERRSSVLSQVAHELEAWDGIAEDEKGQTVANIELLLEFPHRRPTLTFVAKCPNGFPRTFEIDGIRLQTSSGGWYQPIPVYASDGDRLQQGFNLECTSKLTTFALRRSRAQAIAFVAKDSQEHGSALTSHSGLLLGVKSAVMCVEALATSAEAYLTEACGQPCRATRPQNFPQGWVLFQGVTLRNLVAPPPGLETLAPDSAISIFFSGGLKVGNAYLEGAPPKISVSGSTAGLFIDDNAVYLDEDGFVVESHNYLTKGIHTVRVGARTRDIEIVVSDLAHKLTVHPNAPTSRRKRSFSTTIALPHGVLCVLGTGVGEVVYARLSHEEGLFFECNFQPMWAIAHGRRNPKVLCLQSAYPKAETLSYQLRRKIGAQKKIRRLATRWASAIRMTNHPRLRIFDSAGNVDTLLLQQSWNTFKDTSNRVARFIRNL